MTSAYRAFDAIHAALAQAAPDRVPAQGYNTTTGFYISQLRKDGTFRVFVDILGGGYGACRDYDGADAVDNILSNCRNTPIESIEQVHGHLRMKSYALLPDTGGPGEWRGGLGFCREIEVLEEGVVLNLYSDHYKFPPQGASGGGPGTTGGLSVLRDGRTIELTPTSNFDLEPGDLIRLHTGGGGGYGDPRRRPGEAIDKDIEDGHITPAHAAEHYGHE
jgi:N-methylhydantoinase B